MSHYIYRQHTTLKNGGNIKFDFKVISFLKVCAARFDFDRNVNLILLFNPFGGFMLEKAVNEAYFIFSCIFQRGMSSTEKLMKFIVQFTSLLLTPL